MAYTYSGTKITGTSTTAKVFKKSGVKKASKGQTYFNTSTGHVYKCTSGGKASDAKWKYVSTGIAHKPGLVVTSLSAPARQGGHTMKATWKVPADMVNAKKGNRATGLEITWTIDTNDRKDPKEVITTGNENLTNSSINLDGVTIGRTTYRRNSFYPFTSRMLWGVGVSVKGTNAKGKGKAASQRMSFGTPRAPSVSAPTFDIANGRVSFTIDTNAGADNYERYDTKHKITVTDSRLGSPFTVSDGNNTSTSYSIYHDVSGYQSLPYEHFVLVEAEAFARGYCGNSGTARNKFYVSYPAQVTIEDVDVSSIDGTYDGTEKCTVYIKTNSTREHPVDEVRLEYLANCDYSEPREVPGDGWTSTDIVDNADCTALAIGVAPLLPDRGKYTWLRVKSWHANENVLYRYSAYWRLKQVELPALTAADDDIVILSASAGATGTSAVVQLAWNADGQDDSTGTELSWSNEADSWKSTDDPDSYNFTWSDGEIYGLTQDTSIDSEKTYYTRTGEGTEEDPYVYTEVAHPTEEEISTYYEHYNDSALITIKGLEEGETYYIKARRYMEGETITYSDYSKPAICLTSEIPESVVAICERYVPAGVSLSVYWTFAGRGLQTEWRIVDPSTGVPIAEGKGGFGSARIDADRLAAFAVDNTVAFRVEVSTGSEFVKSDEYEVTIIDAPVMDIEASPTLTEQTAHPLSFTATATRLCDLKVIVTSKGATGQFPTGVLQQTEDDTIHSAMYSPTWTENQGAFSATVTLPGGLDFWDLGRYVLKVVAIDRQTGLMSEEKTAEFSVNWAHQAPDIASTVAYTGTADTTVIEDKAYYAYDSTTQTYTDVEPEGSENPSTEGWFEQVVTNYVTLTPVDMTDENGLHHQAVDITLAPPPQAAETDVYDIYRMTGDGARLIGRGFPLTYTGRDEYAPFGEDMTMYYRVAIRTADGDVSFTDFEYVLDCNFLRFDWMTGSLELPYNLSIADKYKKDVEIRSHMDGSMAGFWNQNIERSGSFSSDVIRLTQQDDIDAARQLARYTGPVFVRTPDGSAYEADVQVTDLSTEGVLSAIAIDATEIGLTQEFLLPVPFRLPDPEESGGE